MRNAGRWSCPSADVVSMSDQKIVIANCLDHLRKMPDESVDVCVTSPPYWALRDYGSEPIIWGGMTDCEHDWEDHTESARGGVNEDANVTANKDGEANNRGHPTVTQYCTKCGAWRGQLGLEPSPLEYIDHLMLIFDEVKRVLKPTGACWVNLGDTYATVSGSEFQGNLKAVEKVHLATASVNELRKNMDRSLFPQKSLCQIPSRFAIAMTDRGWILRNKIIWHRDNAMPSSIKDRFTVDFEEFFFFTKNPKYYFKQQFEPVTSAQTVRRGIIRSLVNSSKWGDDEKEASVRQGMNQNRGTNIVEKRYSLPEKMYFVEFMKKGPRPIVLTEGTDISVTTAEHWFRSDYGFSYPTAEDWKAIRSKVDDGSEIFRNIDRGLTEITYETDDIMKNSDGEYRNARTLWSIPTEGKHYAHCAMFPVKLIERPIDACCPPGGVVLDPFAGSGTVLEYCYEHDIDAIGIEINPEFEQILKTRAKSGQKRLSDF